MKGNVFCFLRLSCRVRELDWTKVPGRPDLQRLRYGIRTCRSEVRRIHMDARNLNKGAENRTTQKLKSDQLICRLRFFFSLALSLHKCRWFFVSALRPGLHLSAALVKSREFVCDLILRFQVPAASEEDTLETSSPRRPTQLPTQEG